MARLAKRRKTHLSRSEIAGEALRQFDHGEDPSIRSLAAALAVSPSAIYHHFSARSEIVDAALGLVWEEAGKEGMRLAEGKLDRPDEILIAAALATRRAFGRHPQVALHIAATPAANDQLAANLGLIAAGFEGLGLHGEAAARAFHAYGSFAIGSTLVLAARLNLATPEPNPGPDPSPVPDDDTRASLEAMVNLSYSDPVRDEELFVDGLRRLIASFTATSAPTAAGRHPPPSPPHP
ncbi:MAG: TetR family transcriptional regulator [Actinobacteria bacterium]|nr:TetR family transcriptional regulator [Actinomycetota bacterium]